MTSPADQFNQRTIAEFRANHGRVGGNFAGAPLLLLHTVGARSGQPRINPMMYLPDGDRYLVFASKAGSDRCPDWYWNLRTNPDVTIEVDDETITVLATELTGAERDEKYRIQSERYPGFAAYQQKTSRTIPVIALTRRSAPGDGSTPLVVASRPGRPGTWLRGRATPAGADRVHARRWAILAVLCLSVFLALIDNTIVNVALPSISKQLHATTSDLQWIVDAYSLVFASLLLVGGSLGDRYGRKGALQIGLVAFAVFSAFAGLSGSTHVLIVARCLMGAAAALIFPATLAILTNTFTDAKERAAAVGVWTGITGLGVALGPITGGLLLEHFSWSSVFFATIPIAVLALALGAWLVPASRDPVAPRLDLVGFAASIAGVAAVVYTTIEAPARGWLAPVTLVGYGAGVALLAVFAVWERRVGEPMLDVTLFRNVRFSAASFSIAVAFFGLFGFIFLITQYFQLVHGFSPLSAGLRTLPFALGVGAAAPAAPIFARRLGTKIVVPAGLMLMGGGFLIASTLGSDSAYFGPVLVSMVLMAVGLGLVTAPSTGAILAVLPLGKAGVGSAVNDVTRELGGTFGVAVVGAVFSSVYGPRLAQLLHGAGLPAPALAAARQSAAAALQVAGRAPASTHAVIIDAADRAFVVGLSRGSLVCAGVVALGAVFAFLVLPRRLPGTPPSPPAAPGSRPGQTSSAKLSQP